jgi:hypothetical protein
MAASMRAEGTSFSGNVALDLAVYDYARSVGNMEIMNLYADALYDSSGEYLDVFSFYTDYSSLINPVTIMPIDGGLSASDKSFNNIYNGVNALMGMLINTVYKSILSISSNQRISLDALKDTSGGAVEAALESSENLKNISNKVKIGSAIMGILKMLAGTDVAPTNYTHDGEQYKKIAALEKDFLKELVPALRKMGGVVQEEQLSGSTLGNLRVTGIISDPVKNILETMNEVKTGGKEKYNGIEIYYEGKRIY